MSSPDSDDILLTTDEAAQRLRMHRFTLYREYKQLDIPHVRIGKSLRFRPSALRAWMAQHEQQGGGE